MVQEPASAAMGRRAALGDLGHTGIDLHVLPELSGKEVMTWGCGRLHRAG